MARSVEETNSAIARVEHMPFGPARSQAAATEVAKVEADGPEQCMAYALNVLIASYTFTGEQEKAYVPFSRLVQLYDTRPDLFDEKDHYDLQWAFKWMVGGLPAFSSIPAERIDDAIADMEARFGVDGIGAKTVIRAKYFWALHRYGLAEADQYFQKWRTTPNDEVFGSECRLCTYNTEVFYLLECERGEEALAKFDAAMADPECGSKCFQEPAAMSSTLMMWLVQRGQPGDDERAIAMYRRVREQTDAEPTDFVAALARCLQFLAITGHPERALRYLDKYSKWVLKAESPLERLQFLSRGSGALRVIVDAHGMGDTKFSIKGIPTTTVAELRDWLVAEANKVTAEFDARNGSTVASDRIGEIMDIKSIGRKIDLKLQIDLSSVTDDVPDGVATKADVAVDATTAAPPTTNTPAAGAPDTTEPSSPPTPEQEAKKELETAETKVRFGEAANAIPHYLNAATFFRSIGRLQDAGFAYAEAAVRTLDLDDPDTASTLFGKALSILYGVNTQLPYLAPMINKYLSALFDSAQHNVATEVVFDFDARMDKAITASEKTMADAKKSDDHSSPEWLFHQRLLEARAQTALAHSRLAAEAGDVRSAAALAEKAGEQLAGFGSISLACDAFRIAGDLLASESDEHALYCYESAMEAAGILHQRERRIGLGDTLVAFLKAQGREDEADAMARRIAGL